MPELRLGLLQRVFGLGALAELADFKPDIRDHFQQLVIRFPYIPAEELNDPFDLARDANRESEPSVQPDPSRHIGPKELRVERHIRDPTGLTARPDPSRQPFPRRERLVPRRQRKCIALKRRSLPLIQAPEHVGLLIKPPKHTEVPLKTFPDGLNDLRHSFFQCR